MSALSLELVVRKIMPVPLRVISVITRFRVTGRGSSVGTREFVLVNQAAPTPVPGGKELVVGTDKPLSVVVTLPNTSTLNFTVNSLLILTQDYSSVTLAYVDAGQPTSATARVTLVQS